MKKIASKGTVDIFEFVPSLTNLILNTELMKPKWSTWVLYFLKYFFKYKIYYIYDNDIPIHYRTVSFGYFFKHPYVNKGEILLGPSFTKEEARGNGISSFSLSTILSHVEYTRAYAFVLKDNVASNRVVGKNGFQKIGYGDYKGIFSIFKLSKNELGNRYIVYERQK